MKEEYTLEKLLLKFMNHSDRWRKLNGDLVEEHKKNYPNEEIPDHLKCNFDLPLALSVICNEILILKEGQQGARS